MLYGPAYSSLVGPSEKMPNTVTIDLNGIKTKEALIEQLGSALELGGPDGNHRFEAVNAGEGWGLNWDALNDSRCYLDSGGIWGTSTKFKFPLTLNL